MSSKWYRRLSLLVGASCTQEANVPVTFMANSEVLTWGDVDYREEAIVRALLEGTAGQVDHSGSVCQ